MALPWLTVSGAAWGLPLERPDRFAVKQDVQLTGIPDDCEVDRRLSFRRDLRRSDKLLDLKGMLFAVACHGKLECRTAHSGKPVRIQAFAGDGRRGLERFFRDLAGGRRRTAATRVSGSRPNTICVSRLSPPCLLCIMTLIIVPLGGIVDAGAQT